MAIFGDNKKGGEKRGATQKSHHARMAKLTGGFAHEVIRAPWFSEKALIGTERGVYTFSIAPRASKSQVAGAIKEIYGVEPRAVRMLTVKGKRKALRTKRGMGQRAARHKAYVYLNAGDTITLA
ncbi:MAG: 50S ribosomal protein L23 [bacterium]|nr:50S ribosomal protein L23 [bacterium]